MFVFTYLMANHFPWTYRYRDRAARWSGAISATATSKATASTNICAARHMSAHDYRRSSSG